MGVLCTGHVRGEGGGRCADVLALHSRGCDLAWLCAGSGVTGFTQFDVKEQSDDGTTYRFRCPPGCVSIAITAGEIPPFNTNIFGSDVYADISYICAAAAHAGFLTDAGGLVELRVEEGLGPNASNTTGRNLGCVLPR